jgi:hypothetical protein
LSIAPCNQNSSPSGPLLKGADGQSIPSWGLIKKTAIQRQTFHIQFLAVSVRPSTPLLQKIPDSVAADVKSLLKKFPAILRTGDVKPSPTHGVEHPIHIGSHPPVYAKSRRLNLEKLQIAKAEFKRLVSAGIVHRLKLPWASPLHMVPKKDGSWLLCSDYCHLNLVTTPDKYPLPNMQDLLCASLWVGFAMSS